MDECTFEGCDKSVSALGLCPGHYMQNYRGLELTPIKRRPGNGRITSRYIRSDGYAFVYIAGKGDAPRGGIPEHRLVMSETMGRPLTPGENVHHINGVRDDNRPENLELWNTSQPAGQRVDDKVRFALDILHLYRPDLLKETK